MSHCNPLNYGFQCNIVKPRNVLGKVFGYIDSLTRGTRTDSGVTLTGKGGQVEANAAEAGIQFQARSYPKECMFLAHSDTACGGGGVGGGGCG